MEWGAGEEHSVRVGKERGGKYLVRDTVGAGRWERAEPLVVERRDGVSRTFDVPGSDRDFDAQTFQQLSYDAELCRSPGVHSHRGETHAPVGGQQAQGQHVVRVAGLHVEHNRDRNDGGDGGSHHARLAPIPVLLLAV
ncbi:hypothetical protein ACVWZD_000462 [Streptomyces sp. TE3672]